MQKHFTGMKIFKKVIGGGGLLFLKHPVCSGLLMRQFLVMLKLYCYHVYNLEIKTKQNTATCYNRVIGVQNFVF